MPVCRKCKKQWPDTMTACPDDGWSFTVESDATYHPPVAAAPRPVTSPVAAAPRPVTSPRVATAAPRPASIRVLETAAPDVDVPPPTDLMPGFMVGEYRIEKKIGEGGMGAVYGSVHPLIGKRAAIKVISAALGADSSAVNRFV